MPKPSSFQPDLIDAPDLTMKQVEVEYGILRRMQYKLIRDGEIESFVFAGWRRISRASILAYRQRQISKGPQLESLPLNQKRRPGRPRKHPRPAPETATASATE